MLVTKFKISKFLNIKIKVWHVLFCLHSVEFSYLRTMVVLRTGFNLNLLGQVCKISKVCRGARFRARLVEHEHELGQNFFRKNGLGRNFRAKIFGGTG